MQIISANVDETLKPHARTRKTLVINIFVLTFIQVVRILQFDWKKWVVLLYRFPESSKNEMKSYMRHYVPYKPGDEFKYRTPEGKPQ